MINISDGTRITSHVYDCNNLIVTTSECGVSRDLYAARQIRHGYIEALRDHKYFATHVTPHNM
jgi:hypothetical protein